MDPDTLEEDELIGLSSILTNLTEAAVSRELALSIARYERLPTQARMQAYLLAGPPLEADGVALVVAGFHGGDWARHYVAGRLVRAHADPAHFLGELLRDGSIPLKRRRDLAADVAKNLPEAAARRAFSNRIISDSTVDEEIRLTLQLVEARFGDSAIFENLVEGIGQIPIDSASTAIALFGPSPIGRWPNALRP